ncbi:hypothetical protein [Rhodococcus sp. HNM0569]|uniref:hypothetical protein n=1 Tax=Rhodococcus sp. HNM0569 TaxID=2716340 RepID=UPI00146D5E3D|nr:hypothetical protein [Rhodococcus sp. HNM0569]NLU82974.1 hypothetical protein [Rhodococcus sp. HNM0569]
MSAGDRRDSGSQPDDDRRPLSYALVALSSLGAVLSITAMGVVSTRLTRRAYGPPGEQTSRRHPGPGSRP